MMNYLRLVSYFKYKGIFPNTKFFGNVKFRSPFRIATTHFMVLCIPLLNTILADL